MANFVWLENDVSALNMDHVMGVDNHTGPEGTMIALKLVGGQTLLLDGDKKRRVLAWLGKHAELPILLPGGHE